MYGVSINDLVSLNVEYEDSIYIDDIERYQLIKINEIWKDSFKTIPYYEKLMKANRIPKTFNSISEFKEFIPVTTRNIIKENIDNLCFPTPRYDFMRVTGGSTSEPIQIPAWSSELNRVRHTTHLGRFWYGIRPGDRLFLFWGHSHLLGIGIKGKFNALLRKFKDYLNNYYRFSCYDLSTKNLLEAGKEIIKRKPNFILGYSYSLDRLARENAKKNIDFSSLNLKVIIAAAESFPFEDSQEVISSTFGTNIAMEYGSVETNLIAHTHPSGGYWVFWKDCFLEAIESNGVFELLVTTLYRRKTPLFRYKIGDCIKYDKSSVISDSGSIIRFSSVVGRSNNPVILKSGKKLHSEIVSHIVRDNKGVNGYQFVCSNRSIKLNLIIAESSKSKSKIAAIELNIRNKALKVDKEFSDTLQVSVVEELQQSISGKTPMVVYS
jgi:phenylacetate-CoA ligase